jgi:hypothetical protein
VDSSPPFNEEAAVPLFWKEVISPDSYWYTDDAGAPHKFEATPEYVRYLHDQGNRMLAAGLSIPIPLEHQRDAKPLTAAEKAAKQLEHNAGWVQKYALRADHKLFALCDIADPKIAAKLPRTIKFTSPNIDSFVDGSGREWKGVISHLALTSRPRIVRQEPFRDAVAALSLARVVPFDKEKVPQGGVLLSRAGSLDPQGIPRHPKAFSVWSGIKLAEEVIKEEKVEKPGEKPKETLPATETPLEMMGEEDLDMDLVDVVCDLMSIYGVEMPEGTDEKNLLQNLLKSLMEHLKGEGQPDMGSDTMTQGSDTTKTAPTVESPPLYMSLSLEEIAKITDPEKKSLANALFSMQQASTKDRAVLDALKKSKLDDASSKRNAKIERIVKRARKEQQDSMKARLTAQAALPAMAFSLGDDGVVTDPMKEMLDILEQGMLDLPAVLTQDPKNFAAQPHPLDADGQMPEERRKAVVEELAAGAGVSKK